MTIKKRSSGRVISQIGLGRVGSGFVLEISHGCGAVSGRVRIYYLGNPADQVGSGRVQIHFSKYLVMTPEEPWRSEVCRCGP